MERDAADPGRVLVLAGGAGRRLGVPKAWLPWDGRPLLLEVVERLAPLAAAEPWVAARPGQDLPPGPYRRADDDVEDGGPLAGLAAGLAAIAAHSPDARVAVAACDYPFADPGLFRSLARARPRADLVVPRCGGHLHPTHAVWRASLAAACRSALASGERRVRPVLEAAGAEIVDADSLGVADPELVLLNVNDPESLARAREAAPRRPA